MLPMLPMLPKATMAEYNRQPCITSEIHIIQKACFPVTSQLFLNPVYNSHHLHGSVNHSIKGSHERKSVIPAEKAYTLSTPGKGAFFPANIIRVTYPMMAEINTVPRAFMKNMIPIIHTGCS